ncbi:hypothetical protein [Salmonella enterica]|nr:hypothetical protein [Salmonella enterica]
MRHFVACATQSDAPVEEPGAKDRGFWRRLTVTRQQSGGNAGRSP